MTGRAFFRFAAAAVGLLLGWPLLAAAEPLTLAASRGPVSLLIYVAQERGLFKREGIDVQVQDCSSGRQCVELLHEGKADVATAAELVVSLGSFQRADAVIIGTISASSHQIKLMARRSAGITEPAQLAGKRVGTVSGTSAQYFLDTWLLFHAIDPKAVRTVPLPPQQLAEALQKHELDAIAIWEPVASKAAKALGSDALEMPNPRVYTQYFSLVTQREAASRRAAELERLLSALIEAQKFVTQRPAEARRILVTRLALDAETADMAAAHIKENDFRVRLDQALINTMSSQMRWAIDEGHATGSRSRPAAVGVEPSLLRRVAPEAVTLVR